MLVLILSLSTGAWGEGPEPFRLSLYVFPQNLDPQTQSSSSSYLFQNLFRNLFLYTPEGLKTDMAEKCVRESRGRLLVCDLKKDLKWNDGSPLTAQDFLKTYHKILDPIQRASRPDLLFTVKNAAAVYAGKKSISELGIQAPTPRQLRFEFTEPDGEFEYNLSSSFLSPTKGSYELKKGAIFLTNGPYQVKSWDLAQGFVVEANPLYHPKKNTASRPPVEFLVITEDTVSLRLYEKKELNLVRRLPTLLTNKYRTRSDFHFVSVLRFDYLGFGPELKDQLQVRQALSHSLDFPEWQKLLFSKGQPGCLGLPDSWFEKKPPCLKMQSSPLTADQKKGRFLYSLQGGDDHRRTAEWLQSQWKKNLRWELPIKGLENKNFVTELKVSPPAIFRKGLAPDRPTCSGILENFTSEHPENYIRNKNPEFDKWVQDLRAETSVRKKKQICQKAFTFLLQSYGLIPTGAYDLTLLASLDFKGWTLNELNQLDLTNLHRK